MTFAKVKQGPSAGQFVRYRFAVGNPALRIDPVAPRNPYPSGYGGAIPTRYRVRTINQRWRRVYCMNYSNSGTLYIRQQGELIIVDIDN